MLVEVIDSNEKRLMTSTCNGLITKNLTLQFYLHSIVRGFLLLIFYDFQFPKVRTQEWTGCLHIRRDYTVQKFSVAGGRDKDNSKDSLLRVSAVLPRSHRMDGIAQAVSLIWLPLVSQNSLIFWSQNFCPCTGVKELMPLR